MTDLDRFTQEVASADEASLGDALRTLLKLREVAPELFAVAKAARAHMPGSWHEKSPIGYGESRDQLDRTLCDLDAKLGDLT